MRFCGKKNRNAFEQKGWEYPKDRDEIRKFLRKEQSGFCAYSEKYLMTIDSQNGATNPASEIEHFYPKGQPEYAHLKHEYTNLYLVDHTHHKLKPRQLKDEHLPIIAPCDAKDRIEFVDGAFQAKRIDDIEAENLIDFLGLDREEYVTVVANHVQRLTDIKQDKGESIIEYLRKHPEELSFISALKDAELHPDLDKLMG